MKRSILAGAVALVTLAAGASSLWAQKPPADARGHASAEPRLRRRAAQRLGAATKEFVFYADGDGQYDVSELPRLIERVGPKTGLVNGYKLERHDPAHRIWIGKMRSLLDEIQLTSTKGTICVELVRKLDIAEAVEAVRQDRVCDGWSAGQPAPRVPGHAKMNWRLSLHAPQTN